MFKNKNRRRLEKGCKLGVSSRKSKSRGIKEIIKMDPFQYMPIKVVTDKLNIKLQPLKIG